MKPQSSLVNWINASATVVTAVATFSLLMITSIYVWLTNRYVNLTHELVLLQQTPAVDMAVNPFQTTKLVIRNSSTQDVVEVQGWWTAYLYREPSHIKVATFFYIEPSAASSQAWWVIPRLPAAQQESKDLAELLSYLGKNIDAVAQTDRMARRTSPGFLAARLVLTIQYRREVDRKLFRTQLIGVVHKDSITGNYFLSTTPYTPEPPD